MEAEKIEYIPKYSYKDYLKWEGRWELIDGNAYAMTPLPVIKHQEITLNIAIELKSILKNCDKCQVLLPVDWKINEETIVQPDISVVCKKIEGKFLDTPPVMIFEVLSPSTAFKDKTIKYQIYELQRVKYYIIVDIKSNSAEIFFLEDNSYQKAKEVRKEKFTFDLDECKIDFDFGKIWEK